MVPCELQCLSWTWICRACRPSCPRNARCSARLRAVFWEPKRVGFQGKMWENPVNPIFFMGKIWKNMGTYGKIHENPLEIKCKPHFMGLNGHIFGGLRCKHGLIKWRFLQPCLSGCSIQKMGDSPRRTLFFDRFGCYSSGVTHIGIVKFPIDK